MFQTHIGSAGQGVVQAPDFEGASMGGGASPFRESLNILGAQIGGAVRLNDPDLQSLKFTIKEIHSNRLSYDGTDYKFNDYWLEAAGAAGTDHLQDSDGMVRVRLRCIPLGGGKFETLAFQQQSIVPNGDELLEGLRAGRGAVGLAGADGCVYRDFYRVEDVTDAYVANRSILSAGGQPREYSIEYLDYQRETRDAGGTPYTQYALVECDRASRELSIFFGWELDSKGVRCS